MNVPPNKLKSMDTAPPINWLSFIYYCHILSKLRNWVCLFTIESIPPHEFCRKCKKINNVCPSSIIFLPKKNSLKTKIRIDQSYGYHLKITLLNMVVVTQARVKLNVEWLMRKKFLYGLFPIIFREMNFSRLSFYSHVLRIG